MGGVYGLNRNMNIMFVLTCVVKYEKRTAFRALVKRFLKFKKENPTAFDGLKSGDFSSENTVE
jgi:hypothetical protein